ncbi:MAG: hypothetical protein ACOYVK_14670 [Bacillota bacterium]
MKNFVREIENLIMDSALTKEDFDFILQMLERDFDRFRTKDDQMTEKERELTLEKLALEIKQESGCKVTLIKPLAQVNGIYKAS